MLTAVGAPYLYLLQAAMDSSARPPRGEKALVLPLHGTALLKVDGDHDAYARMVRDQEGPARVCLHIDDLHDDVILSAWKSAGRNELQA